jgi:hypothetical protein
MLPAHRHGEDAARYLGAQVAERNEPPGDPTFQFQVPYMHRCINSFIESGEDWRASCRNNYAPHLPVLRVAVFCAGRYGNERAASRVAGRGASSNTLEFKEISACIERCTSQCSPWRCSQFPPPRNPQSLAPTGTSLPSQGIESGNSRAQKRRCFGGAECVRYRRQCFDGSDHVLLVSPVVAKAGKLRVGAVKEGPRRHSTHVLSCSTW